MTTQSDEVDKFVTALEHPLKAEVDRLRKAILAASDQVTEQIKWNAPSFGINGNDRVTFNLHAQDHFKLIFHRGAKPPEDAKFTFEDDTGWLEWAAPDRAVFKVENMADLEAKESRLIGLINRWIEATS